MYETHTGKIHKVWNSETRQANINSVSQLKKTKVYLSYIVTH